MNKDSSATFWEFSSETNSMHFRICKISTSGKKAEGGTEGVLCWYPIHNLNLVR